MDFNRLTNGSVLNSQWLAPTQQFSVATSQTSQTASLGKRSAAQEAFSDLLEQLNQVLTQSVRQSDTETATTLVHQGGRPPLPTSESDFSEFKIAMPAQVLALIGEEGGDGKELSPKQIKLLVKHYLAIQQALAQIEADIQAGKRPENEHQDAFKYLEEMQALSKQLEEFFDRTLKRHSSQAWYTLWRLTYRDEIETKKHIREQRQDESLSSRSLPEGVDPSTAHAALTENLSRPDLEHVSQILQGLKDNLSHS